MKHLKLFILICLLLTQSLVFAGKAYADKSIANAKWQRARTWQVNNFPANPLKTGQTTSYGTNDDGALQSGVSPSYTILTTGQYSGTSQFSMPPGTDEAISQACVEDNRTGLMWMRDCPTGLGPAANGLIPWDSDGAGSGSTEFVTQANSGSGFAGHTDWRLPNMSELRSIFLAPTGVNTTAFPSLGSQVFWSSSTYPANETLAFRIISSYGNSYYSTKITAYAILLVRDID